MVQSNQGGEHDRIVGALAIGSPMVSGIAATLRVGGFLAVYFFASGISGVILGFHVKPDKGWGWLFFDGVTSVLLGLAVRASGSANSRP